MKSELIIDILLFSLIPLFSMFIGGLAGAYLKVTSSIRSLILHLAAGVIFAVVAVEILPGITPKHAVLPLSIGFFMGLFLMFTIRYFTRKSEKSHKALLANTSQAAKILPLGMLVGIAVDIILDGFLLGIGFAAGQKEGILLCIALSIEILALGLVVSAELIKENFSKKIAVRTVGIIAFGIVLGALCGALLLKMITGNTLIIMLSFGLAALLYLITEELLVEAHEEKDSTLNSAVFFIGFFLFLVIGMLE